MKEKVKELFEQAGTDTSGKWMSIDNAEKFAELIVKECAEVAGCNGHVSGFSLGDLIKEHFGVK